MNEGRKDDAGKLRWTLLPITATEEVIRVLMHGAERYGDYNWQKVLDEEGGGRRYIDASIRHIMAYGMGISDDKDSGLHPLAHAICSLLFVLDDEVRKDIRAVDWQDNPQTGERIAMDLPKDDPQTVESRRAKWDERFMVTKHGLCHKKTGFILVEWDGRLVTLTDDISIHRIDDVVLKPVKGGYVVNAVDIPVEWQTRVKYYEAAQALLKDEPKDERFYVNNDVLCYKATGYVLVTSDGCRALVTRIMTGRMNDVRFVRNASDNLVVDIDELPIDWQTKVRECEAKQDEPKDERFVVSNGALCHKQSGYVLVNADGERLNLAKSMVRSMRDVKSVRVGIYCWAVATNDIPAEWQAKVIVREGKYARYGEDIGQ